MCSLPKDGPPSREPAEDSAHLVERTPAPGRADDEPTAERLLLDHALILNSIGVGLHAVDRDGIIVFANPAAADLLGWEPDELPGRAAHELTHHTRADGTAYPSAECPILATARDGVSRHVEGELFWRKDGTGFPGSYTSAPIRSESGDLVGAIVSCRDITERKRIEEALALNLEQLTRTEQLLRARNEELKAFAYTVSHDLKAPLRGIAGYAAELDREHRAGLSDRASFCIDQILAATHSLDAMIEDLLRYSGLEAETPTVTAVNLRRLVDGVLQSHQLAIDERSVEVTIDIPFETLEAWERGLSQVLGNLIDNALKYSRDACPPRITVQAREQEDSWLITVRDNGIGVDMEDHDRIFGLFNRLVGVDQFEGTGAGLAIARKVLDMQGGRIWAESAPGEGATFFVELPRSAREAEKSHDSAGRE
jgi:PAS domain S-box-containing protein